MDDESESQVARLYREERDYIRRFVGRLGVPRADTEDVAQEVFVLLYARFHGLERGAGLRFWLRAVAVRIARNHRRGVLRRSAGQLRREDRVDLDTIADPTQQAPEELSVRREQERQLSNAIAGLDRKKREVFVRSELEQQTASEIAEFLRLSPNTVSSRLRAARRHVSHVLRVRAREADVRS
jgi:RNA polymerase sigma-70 factor (ECF subfamily)